MRRSPTTLALLLAGCASVAPRPEAPLEVSGAALDTELSALAQKFFATHQLASLELAAVRDGQIVFSRGFGEAVAGTGLPPDLHTPYRIASLTKLFTGLALAQLREQGKLSFEDRLDVWLPEAAGLVYPTREHPPIRIRNLFTHTSGLPHDGQRPVDGLDETDLLAELYGLRLVTTPGQEYAYSNLAMALAGTVIRRASGQDARVYIARHLLDRLQLEETGFEPAGSVASAYQLEHGKPAVRLRWSHSPAYAAAGGLYSTAFDLAKFALFECSAWPARDEEDPATVVSRAALRETQLGVGPANGINWFTSTLDGFRWVNHTGFFDGQVSEIDLFPRAGIAAVAFAAAKDGEMTPLNELGHAAVTALGRGRSNYVLGSGHLHIQELVLAALNNQEIEPLYRLVNFQDSWSFATATAEFLKEHEEFGTCRPDQVLEMDGWQHAKVRLRCDRKPVEVQWWFDQSGERLTGLRSHWN